MMTTPTTPEASTPVVDTAVEPTVASSSSTRTASKGFAHIDLMDSPTQIRDLFIKEVNAMIRALMSSGVTIPAHVFSVAEAFTVEHLQREQDRARAKGAYQFDNHNSLDIQELSAVHDLLSAAIAPSTPRAVLLLDPICAKKSTFSWLSSVPLLRHLMFVAFFSLVMFILLSLSPLISADGGNIYKSHGLPLLVNLLFFVSASALGACFSALFQANEYIISGIFDPKFETSYWIRLLVGIMAGLILASLIPIEDPTTLNGLGKPTLALLGGFSASLVHRILNLFVGSIEGVVKKMANAMLDAPQDNARKEADNKKAIEQMVNSSVESALQKQDAKA
jgi:hypothetical protein